MLKSVSILLFSLILSACGGSGGSSSGDDIIKGQIPSEDAPKNEQLIGDSENQDEEKPRDFTQNPQQQQQQTLQQEQQMQQQQQ